MMIERIKMIDMTDKNNINKFTIGFIGLGLIGGSIAKTLRQHYPNVTIIGYEHGKSLGEDNELGLKQQVLDRVCDNLDDFASCNIIFLCAPVIQNITYLPVLKDIINPQCIITDVGSVKADIHKHVTDNGLDSNFVGGHPMTGSEKSGFAYANPKLFENVYYILTSTNSTMPEHISIMTNLVKDIGAIPILIDNIDHDKIVAAISHIPHIVAATLVNLVKGQPDNQELLKKLAAGGFRDITRIASSSPNIWENISISNSEFIKDLLNQYIALLQDLIMALEDKNSPFLYNTFASAREYRNELPEKGRGIIEKIFEVYMDIDDEAGSIAMVANLLAGYSISIKNIGIIHNREFYDGVLRIEFYDEESQDHAFDLLKQRGYTVYER